MEDISGQRTWNTARREQGFRSQAHLDAFYAAYDHKKACSACQQPGLAYWNEADASWQPTENRCSEGKRLDMTSFAYFS